MKHLLVSLIRLTVLLLVTLHLALAQSSATYNGPDTSTQGTWTGHYGSDGYQIANNNSLNLSYGTVGISASAYTWTSTATGSPALQTAPNASTYIASAYLAMNSFTINVNLTDGNSHTVAFYLLDWDSGGQRAESITVQNAATGASFPATPTESFTGFNNGLWVSYTVTGNVNFIIQSTNSYLNAVVSGVFFSPAASTSQSQTITFNTVPTQTVGNPLTLTATATSGLPVAYSASPSTICNVSGATATFLTAGGCTITASQAGNSEWAAANPVSQTFTVSGSGSSGQTTASYVTTDATTGGNWTGQYGSDGYQIANDNSLNLSYGSASISAWAYTWTTTASGSPALQTAPNASTYIASGYLARTSFTINVNLTDGKSHTVAFYLLDWDSGGQRAESITVQNATTGASFPAAPTQSFAGFNNGVWVSYTVTGNVNFLFQSTNPYLEAIVSGVFFSTTAPTSQSQTITFNTIPAQTVGTPLTLTATASSGLPVAYTASPSTVCTVSGTTATFLTAGGCTITASQAGNSEWAAANPIPQTFTVSVGSSGQTTASYLATDSTTGGNWTGQYGSDGYQIADDNTLSLSYGSVSISAWGYTWTTTASGSPALQTAPNASTYIASGYLAMNSFTINVNLTDGNSHTVAFYLLDWDSGGQRAESITVQDATTGATFPAAPIQTFTGFNNGIWVSYTVTGNVNFIIQSTNSYLNAVVSGIFFSTPSSSTGTSAPTPNVLGPQVSVFTSGYQWLSETLANSASATVNGAQGVSALGDYDGDGLVDAVTFLNGSFTVQLSSGASFIEPGIGQAGDIPVPGDYDGDGKTDFAVYRPPSGGGSTGFWYYLPSRTPTAGLSSVSMQSVVSDDMAVPGDYDGDGKTDFAIYRKSTGTFYVIQSSNQSGNPVTVSLGKPGDLPAVGDYDGDGKTDYGVFRPATAPNSPSDGATFYYQLSSNPSIVRNKPTLGSQLNDVPVAGDYDRDGHTDFAFWRPSNQTWYIILSSKLGINTQVTTASTGTPVALTPYTKAPGASLSMYATPGSQYTISGIVSVNGNPLSSVIVTVTGTTTLAMATDSNGSYSFTVPAGGAYTVTPGLAGYSFAPALQTFYNLSTSPLASFSAAEAQTQTITFGSIAAQTIGASLTLSATASSGLPVAFTSSPASVCTVTGATASFITAGTCTIQASQPGNSTYAAATPVQQMITVSAASLPATTTKDYIYVNGKLAVIENH